MNQNGFLRIIETAYRPFLEEYGFKMGTADLSGKYYEVEFTGDRHVVSVSFEPGDHAFFIFVFSRRMDGLLSSIDETPRLKDLNQRYMDLTTPSERHLNQEFFQNFRVHDEDER